MNRISSSSLREASVDRAEKCQWIADTHLDKRLDVHSTGSVNAFASFFKVNGHLFVIGYFAGSDLLVVMNFNDIYGRTQV